MTVALNKITPILQRSGVKKMAIFGSAVYGKMHKTSDVNIVVEPSIGMTLLDIVALKG